MGISALFLKCSSPCGQSLHPKDPTKNAKNPKFIVFRPVLISLFFPPYSLMNLEQLGLAILSVFSIQTVSSLGQTLTIDRLYIFFYSSEYNGALILAGASWHYCNTNSNVKF